MSFSGAGVGARAESEAAVRVGAKAGGEIVPGANAEKTGNDGEGVGADIFAEKPGGGTTRCAAASTGTNKRQAAKAPQQLTVLVCRIPFR